MLRLRFRFRPSSRYFDLAPEAPPKSPFNTGAHTSVITTSDGPSPDHHHIASPPHANRLHAPPRLPAHANPLHAPLRLPPAPTASAPRRASACQATGPSAPGRPTMRSRRSATDAIVPVDRLARRSFSSHMDIIRFLRTHLAWTNRYIMGEKMVKMCAKSSDAGTYAGANMADVTLGNWSDTVRSSSVGTGAVAGCEVTAGQFRELVRLGWAGRIGRMRSAGRLRDALDRAGAPKMGTAHPTGQGPPTMATAQRPARTLESACVGGGAGAGGGDGPLVSASAGVADEAGAGGGVGSGGGWTGLDGSRGHGWARALGGADDGLRGGRDEA